MLTLFYLWLSKNATDKDTGIVFFLIDIILFAALCFMIGYFRSVDICVFFTIILLAACLLSPYYHRYREKLRLNLLPPKGSLNKAYLDFQIAFDKRAPWRTFGDAFFELFNPITFVFFAIVITIGKLVAHFVG